MFSKNLFLKKKSGFTPPIENWILTQNPKLNEALILIKQIDFNTYSFSVITYEHDAYNGGESERTESRQILESYGYTRVISNVRQMGHQFEDWYINEKHMPNNNWKEFIGEEIELSKAQIDENYLNLFDKFLD
jgi:hypothetical protein